MKLNLPGFVENLVNNDDDRPYDSKSQIHVCIHARKHTFMSTCRLNTQPSKGHLVHLPTLEICIGEDNQGCREAKKTLQFVKRLSRCGPGVLTYNLRCFRPAWYRCRLADLSYYGPWRRQDPHTTLLRAHGQYIVIVRSPTARARILSDRFLRKQKVGVVVLTSRGISPFSQSR